jgi:hypothetical protein
MGKFWQYVLKGSALINIGSFLMLLSGWSMESIKLFLVNLNPWYFVFFVSLVVVLFALWKEKLRISRPPAPPERSLIRDPSDGKVYLVEGKTCYHIPDPDTFNYLGSYLGFSMGEVKQMTTDDIKSKFIIGKQLPSIKIYFPKSNTTP